MGQMSSIVGDTSVYLNLSTRHTHRLHSWFYKIHILLTDIKLAQAN